MYVKVLLNYCQSFKWVENLDASLLLLVGAGGALAFRTLTSHVPLGLKVPVMVLSVGLDAAPGMARWPIEHKDGAFVRGRRLAEYCGRSRRASLFRVISAAEATRKGVSTIPRIGGDGAFGATQAGACAKGRA